MTFSYPIKNVYAVVMAGGASSRLFPFDKVLADLTGGGRSMIQQAFDRVTTGESPLLKPEHFFVVTGKRFHDPLKRQLPQLPEGNILTEPDRRNTWPAILWAMAHISEENPDAVLAILTADHFIQDAEKFCKNLEQAVQEAVHGERIITLGIPPTTKPEDWTAFGAIQAKKGTSEKHAWDVESFEEKPTVLRAKTLMKQKNCFWNSGMFIARISVLERALESYQAPMYESYLKIQDALELKDESRAIESFRTLPSKIEHPLQEEGEADNSIDYAIMVPLTHDHEAEIKVRLIPAAFPWRDIGSWDALRSVLSADQEQNTVLGDVKAEKTQRSILICEQGKQLVVRDLQDMIVVLGAEYLTVAPIGRAQDFKKLYEKAQSSSGSDVKILIETLDCDVITEEKSVAALDVAGLQIVHKGLEGIVIPKTV